jgi:hypothetical protein
MIHRVMIVTLLLLAGLTLICGAMSHSKPLHFSAGRALQPCGIPPYSLQLCDGRLVVDVRSDEAEYGRELQSIERRERELGRDVRPTQTAEKEMERLIARNNEIVEELRTRSLSLAGAGWRCQHRFVGGQLVRERTLSLPLWMPLMLFVGYPGFLIVFRGALRRRRRRKRNLCIHYGYNLTGLPEPRCPECGREVEGNGEPRHSGTCGSE